MESTPINLVLSAVLGLVASLYGSIVGGAGILSIPGLIFLGLSPEVAIATNKLADLGRFSSASYTFFTEKRIRWSYVFSLLPLAILAGILGARLLILSNISMLKPALGMILIVMSCMTFVQRSRYSEWKEPSRSRALFGYLLYFLFSVYGAAIQVGSGPILLCILMSFFGLKMLEANATSSLCWLFLTISSLCIFIPRGTIHYPCGCALLLGSIVGGHLGTHLAIRKGDVWTRHAFSLVTALLGVKLLVSA